MLRVKIIKCDEPLAWYYDLISYIPVFEVIEWGEKYVLKEDYDRGHNAYWRHILKEDCKLV